MLYNIIMLYNVYTALHYTTPTPHRLGIKPHKEQTQLCLLRWYALRQLRLANFVYYTHNTTHNTLTMGYTIAPPQAQAPAAL